MDEKREQGKLPGWTWAVNIVPTVIATAMVGACLQFDLSWWVGVPIAAAIVLAGLLWERAIEQSISRRNNNPNESEKSAQHDH